MPDQTSCPISLDPASKQAYIALKDTDAFRLTPLVEEDIGDLVDLFSRPEMARWACRRPHPFTKANAAIFNIPTIPYTLNTILSSTSLPPSSPQAREARASFVFNALRETAKGRVIGIIIARPSDRAFPSTTTATDHVSVPVPEDKEGTEGEEWEMAYDVLPEFWGMGLGIKMVSGALGYIKWAGVEQVCALYQPENTASAALLAKAGFVKHGERHVEWPEEKGGGSRLCFKSKLEL